MSLSNDKEMSRDCSARACGAQVREPKQEERVRPFPTDSFLPLPGSSRDCCALVFPWDLWCVAHSVRSRSGQPRTTPADLFERGGRSFLVSAHRQESSNWVRNLRVAEEGVPERGHTRQAIAVVELQPEVAGAVLKGVLPPRLALPVRGFVLRSTLSVPPEFHCLRLWTLPAATPFSRSSTLALHRVLGERIAISIRYSGEPTLTTGKRFPPIRVLQSIERSRAW